MTSSPGNPWGQDETRFFYELTPDRILDAVEACGLRATGRCMALNSMENRVYQVEVEPEVDVEGGGDEFRVVKFYRPGRWSEEQILEEHRFLHELAKAEIPAVAPLPFPDGATLERAPGCPIWCAVFPRVGGRAPDELDDEGLERIGRLIGRLHNVGATSDAPSRVRLDPDSYGLTALTSLLEIGSIPESVRDSYRLTVESICESTSAWFEAAVYQRIHGDCHIGNLLVGGQGAFFVDFDDMVRGPCVQDIWLLAPGKDKEARRQRSVLLEGYEQFREFDYSTLRLVEPLRALRLVHFSAWIARRWDDPAFKRAFPDFGDERYWFDELNLLREQLADIQHLAQHG